ncbi:hypothetical protein GALMADRAFT_234168 [Galerina marginata CBS 339.88]|uniref:Glutaredoxin domain-containing protein n=1 Tax=Galerina marginata (strain CBS 339.88) TaxID=685588 RepID=A0A067TQ78_GALM3|nr:hypothetical protein GALMADRAFT_234168 [Galerina marginata CBS 339.88]
MPSPPIALFMTTIASQPALRQRQEYIFRILQVKKIPFTTYDLASDEDAKRLWRRKAPQDKQQIPGILVGGKFPGTFADFEDAVEHDELDIFLRLKESWDPAIDEDRPPPPVKPVGIPGASSPLQMTPEHLRSKMFAPTSSPSPLKGKIVPVNRRTNELDMGDELSGYGLQGVKVTQDELLDLIAELGLGGDEAGALAKGLSGATKPLSTSTAKKAGKSDARQEEPVPKKEDTVEKKELVAGQTVDPEPAKVEDTKAETGDPEATKADDKVEDPKVAAEKP